MANLKGLEGKTLVTRLEEMAKDERKHQVEILRYLAELDERHIVNEMGYSGMWDFCRRHLTFSESTSTRRVNVARASRKYPALLLMLEDGRLNLETAADLCKVLTEKNHLDLLAAAAGKTAREVQRLVDPADGKASARRDVIRRVTSKNPDVPASALALKENDPMLTSPPAPDVKSVPKSQEPILHRVSFTASDEVVAKLERLQEILGGATLAEVCNRAADLLLDKVDKVRRFQRREQKKQARSTNKPAKAKPRSAEPRKPAAALADRVFVKGGMRCSYEKNGVSCTETRYLTIDHIRPYALGGKSNDWENLRCYCMAHNLLAGRKSFGSFNVQTERSSDRRTV